MSQAIILTFYFQPTEITTFNPQKKMQLNECLVGGTSLAGEYLGGRCWLPSSAMGLRVRNPHESPGDFFGHGNVELGMLEVKEWFQVCMFVCLSVCLFVCLFACLLIFCLFGLFCLCFLIFCLFGLFRFVCLFVSFFVCLFVCLFGFLCFSWFERFSLKWTSRSFTDSFITESNIYNICGNPKADLKPA